MKTPVALIFFNRPKTTTRVFAAIARAKPAKLFLIADGPRPNHPTDEENCAKTRTIVERVDWDCEVFRHYSDVNLGCKMRPVSGISWVFEKVEEAIIFEDDCLPHLSFFPFCEELLERYRADERVIMISGNNFQDENQHSPYSYRFSRYPNTWGWGSWRRAWNCLDVEMRAWPDVEKSDWPLEILGNASAATHWRSVFARTFAASDTVWDYQWLFSCWLQNGLSISPNVNLVSNIGFGEGATHTTSDNQIANLPVIEMTFPLRHPPSMIQDEAADDFVFKLYAQQAGPPTSFSRRIRNRMTRAIESPVRSVLRRLQPKPR